MFHDVIENTYRKNVTFGALHDLDENTGTYMDLSTMLMKTKEKASARRKEKHIPRLVAEVSWRDRRP
jgi:hypothetical protein